MGIRGFPGESDALKKNAYIAVVKAKQRLEKSIKTLFLIGCLVTGQTMLAQGQTQSVNVTVGAIYKISTSASPPPLVISGGTAGSDLLAAVTNSSTTYSITQNFGNTVKITAELDAPIPAGYTLTMALASAKGLSAGSVDISNAVAGSAASVVTQINIGADADEPITYTFSALASAGELSSITRTVTLTLTN